MNFEFGATHFCARAFYVLVFCSGFEDFSRVVIFPKISEKFEIFPKSFGNISIDFSRSENFSLECLAASMALDGYFEGFIVFQRE
jgi:hypothetical protein